LKNCAITAVNTIVKNQPLEPVFKLSNFRNKKASTLLLKPFLILIRIVENEAIFFYDDLISSGNKTARAYLN
jgi:hypothetical protein